MHLSSYLMLVGAAVLVTHLSGTDSYAIGRSSSKVEDHDSKETSADNERMDAARNQTSSAEDSTEDDDTVVEDSSEEQDNIVKRSAQFSRNSDEFDNFSLEINNRPVGTVPTATNTGRLPLVPLSFRNPVLVRQRDDDDDISIEVRNRVVATPVIQQVISAQTVTSGRLPVPISLRNQILRQSDDDFDDVSLEIVNRDRVVLPTPVQGQIVPTQTATSRLPVPIGFRTQLVRESDGDVSLEIVRDINATPNQQAVPSQPNNQVPNVRTPVFRQSDERDDISVEVFGSILNQNGQVPTAVRPVQTSAIRPIQQANNRQQPIQTFSQVNNVPSPRPVTVRPQVQPTPIAVTPVAPIRPTVASSDPLPLVPMSFRNPILVRQRDDDFDDDISIEIRDRVAVSPVVQPVVSTQTLTASSGRLPVPIGLRNSILRQSLEIDDVSLEIRDRNIFTPTSTQQVNQPQANGQVRAPVAPANNRPEFIITQDFDGDVSVELVSRAQIQQNADNQSVQQGFSISPVRPLAPPRQPVAVGSFVQTGNQGQQQQQFNVFDDYSLEDNRDDDDNDYDFFLEDQFDNVDGFRFLASDFFSQPPGDGFPSVRSVKNHRKITKKDHDDTHDSVAIHLEPVSLDESDFHVPAESDDWFLVKQYMDHDYSSEELEGELAKAYFWQPVKDSKKLKTDEDKMAELKPARS